MIFLPVTMLLAAAATDQFAELPSGAKVHYTVEGEGPVSVVEIHGWACNATFWRLQAPALTKEQYRVISVDLPGHGQSEAPNGVDYTIEYFAQGVTAVLKHAGVTHAVLMGHSMGVPVAVRVFRDNPAIVDAIVALDGPIWKARRTTPQPWLKDLQRDYRGVATRFIESMFVTNTPLFVRAEIKRKMLLTPPHVGISAMQVMGASDVWLKGPVRIPVLAVVATRRATRYDDRKRLHQDVFPNMQYEFWGEAGHFLMMEQPDRFNRLLVGFLHSVPGLHSLTPTTH